MARLALILPILACAVFLSACASSHPAGSNTTPSFGSSSPSSSRVGATSQAMVTEVVTQTGSNGSPTAVTLTHPASATGATSGTLANGNTGGPHTSTTGAGTTP